MLQAQNRTVAIAASQGGTVLGHAIGSRNVEVVEALLAAGADPNAGFDGLTPLAYAAYLDFVSGVDALLLRGVLPDTRVLWPRMGRGDSWTALMLASCRGNSGVVSVLLQHGANPALRTPKGDTAMSLAGKCDQRVADIKSALERAEQKDRHGASRK